MAQFAVQMITNKARMSAAQVLFQPEGSAKLYSFGNVTALEFTPNLQEFEDTSREEGIKQIIGIYLVQKDGTITLRTRSWTEVVYQLAMMSDKAYVVRAADEDVSVTYEDVAVGDIYRTTKRVTITSATDGALEDPVAWVEGTHFTYHPQSGVVQILAIPAGSEPDLHLEFDVEAITDSDKLLSLQVLGNEGVTGRLIAIGTNQVGQKGELNLGRVQFRPDGAVPFVGGDEGDEASLTGRVFAEPGVGYGTWTSYGAV